MPNTPTWFGLHEATCREDDCPGCQPLSVSDWQNLTTTPTEETP